MLTELLTSAVLAMQVNHFVRTSAALRTQRVLYLSNLNMFSLLRSV